MAKSGISDISSSEGKLQRFTLICKLIGSERRLTKKKLAYLMEKRIGSPFKNRKVIQRHLVILEKIGIIENLDGIYVLSSEGKALFRLTQQSSNIDQLSFEERAFYFKVMFTSILKEQLIKFLEVLCQHAIESRKEIIAHYFSTELAASTWSKHTIEKNLDRLRESGKIPTFFENKFRCMEMWLEDIGLVKREKNKILPKADVKTLLDKVKKGVNLKKEVYGLIGDILVGHVIEFDYNKHKHEFMKTFREAYLAFKTQSGISDIKAIMTFTSINLVRRKIKLEEEEFNTVIKKLWSEGIVKSIMLGRDGKAAFIVLSEPI